MANDQATKELWVGWTHDALSGYEPEEGVELDDLADEMVEVATKYADSMLDEYEDRFGAEERGTASRRRKKTGAGRRKTKPDDKDEDDD